MTTKQVVVERVTFVSNRSFEEVLELLDKGIGRKNYGELNRRMDEAATFEEFSSVIHSAVGSADLMEFMRLDLGSAIGRDPSAKAYKIVRIIAGNPLIMKQMVEHAPDAGSCAPITILVYEQGDGAHISYDTMASHLASSNSEKALQVAKDLDAKVLRLLTDATAPR
jgi:uncharacterized protein (DUF302 family)